MDVFAEDLEFVAAVRVHGSKIVDVIARSADEQEVFAALEAYLASRPKHERGRHYMGEVNAGISDLEFLGQVATIVGMMDQNIDKGARPVDYVIRDRRVA